MEEYENNNNKETYQQFLIRTGIEDTRQHFEMFIHDCIDLEDIDIYE